MLFIRAFGRGILLIIFAASLAAWISLSTLNATILNRDVVKGWLEESGVYANLLSTIVKVGQAEQGSAVESSPVTLAALQEAIKRTFPPEFLQTHVEAVLDSSYDWMEGKKPAITFSIPLSEKRAEFATNLAAVLEPELAKLPPCAATLTADTSACVPPGKTAGGFAAELATQVTQQSDFFDKPITEQTFMQNGDGQNVGPLPTAQLPRFVPLVGTLIWALPIVLLVTGVGYVLLSSVWLSGVGVIGRRLLFGAMLPFILGVLGVTFGGTIQLGLPSGGEEQAIVTMLVQPLVNQIAPDVGRWMMLFSGTAMAVGLALWIAVIIIRRQKEARIRDVPITPPQNMQGPSGLPPQPPSAPPPPVPPIPPAPRPPIGPINL